MGDELIRKSEAFWKTEWIREDYGDEGRGDYNHWLYSKSVCVVSCSACHKRSGAFEWNKDWKDAPAKSLEHYAYTQQFERIKEFKTPYCPYCGAKMEDYENEDR